MIPIRSLSLCLSVPYSLLRLLFRRCKRWRSGRKDDDVAAVPPGGRLPAADKGNPMATAQGLRDVFYRMGFNDREIVALSGAHALGRYGNLITICLCFLFLV